MTKLSLIFTDWETAASALRELRHRTKLKVTRKKDRLVFKDANSKEAGKIVLIFAGMHGLERQ